MMTSDEEVVSHRLDLEMLERPHLWVECWKGFPAIMLKKRDAGEWRWTGPCVQWSSDSYVVMARDWANGGRGETFTYATPRDIVSAGWVVD